MKRVFHISTKVDEPTLLENLVEKLAMRRAGNYHSPTRTAPDLKSMETASTETFVSGSLQIEQGEGTEAILIQTPFITQFLFTCIREKEDQYQMEWSSSLS